MIRPATSSDAIGVAALEAELFGGEAWSLAQVVDELSGFGRAGWVIDNPMSGYAIIRTVADVSDLQRIAVASAAQGQGIGARLLSAAINGATRAGAERMLLEVAENNEPALALYARAGFVVIDRRPKYYADGRTALVMQLDLA